jgi:hypothetical protein
MALPKDTREWRERVEDGELIPVEAEDKQAAEVLADQMFSILEGRQAIHALLAVQILSNKIVTEVAGKAWAKALDAVFRVVPIN